MYLAIEFQSLCFYVLCGNAVMAVDSVRHKEQQKVPVLVVHGVCPGDKYSCSLVSMNAAATSHLISTCCTFECRCACVYYHFTTHSFSYCMVTHVCLSKCAYDSQQSVQCSTCVVTFAGTLTLEAAPDQLLSVHVCQV